MVPTVEKYCTSSGTLAACETVANLPLEANSPDLGQALHEDLDLRGHPGVRGAALPEAGTATSPPSASHCPTPPTTSATLKHYQWKIKVLTENVLRSENMSLTVSLSDSV